MKFTVLVSEGGAYSHNLSCSRFILQCSSRAWLTPVAQRCGAHSASARLHALAYSRAFGPVQATMSELGLHPVRDRAHSMKIADFCNALVQEATQQARPISRFPGTMAMSLSRRHKRMIANNDYVALEKSDGMRYLLLALKEFVVLIDRRMNVFQLDPNPCIPSFGAGAMGQPQENTLLDGELTHNMALDCWEYLIFDVVVIDNDMSVAQMDFRERMHAAEVFVAAPRVWSPAVSGLLRLRVKDYYEKPNIRSLFDHIKKQKGESHWIYINHARRDGIICNINDGVIFQPCIMPYTVKNCHALLKWKPPVLNSIDFALELERAVDPKSDRPTVRSYIAYRSDKGNTRLREAFFPSTLKKKWAADFNKHNNSIVELSYDRKAGEWRYIRTREDKDVPNFSTTVIDTMESIAEHMDREELVLFLEQNSLPIPPTKARLVHEQAASRKLCTHENDLFGEDNLAYATTTPMSRVPPPAVRPRARGHGARGGRGAGGRGGASRHSAPPGPVGPGGGLTGRPMTSTSPQPPQEPGLTVYEDV